MKKCKCKHKKEQCTPSKAGWKLQSLRKFLKKSKSKSLRKNVKKTNTSRENFEQTLKVLNESADRANVRFASRKPDLIKTS